jgi:predicted kinase
VSKIIILKGLPASGKSTWAREQAKRKGVRRVCRDDIRRMLGNYDDFNEAREGIVTRIEREAVKAIVAQGDTAIIDATHLDPKYQAGWAALFPDVHIEVRDFPVTLRDAIKRNSGRPHGERVPNKVIHEMYAKWLAPIQRGFVEGLPRAIIMDMDGTATLIGKRSPYDASKAHLVDSLNDSVHRMVLSYLIQNPVELIVMTGREAKHRRMTEKQLAQHGFPYSQLFTRATDDHREDSVVKKELFMLHIDGKYNIDFAVDDRDRVVDMWHSLGITTFQVGEGSF